MGYNCVVLAKQVPDTHRITGQVMNDDGTVNRGALPAIFNPEDLNAPGVGPADQGPPRRPRYCHHDGASRGDPDPAGGALSRRG